MGRGRRDSMGDELCVVCRIRIYSAVHRTSCVVYRTSCVVYRCSRTGFVHCRSHTHRAHPDISRIRLGTDDCACSATRHRYAAASRSEGKMDSKVLKEYIPQNRFQCGQQ